jgi:transposase
MYIRSRTKSATKNPLTFFLGAAADFVGRNGFLQSGVFAQIQQQQMSERRPLKAPARCLFIVARPIFDAVIHELERLRCALCGKLFTAPAPAAAQAKYDPSVGTMLALLRYGAGLPMYRIAKWQACFGIPLPASTQWELIDQAAAAPERIYETLLDLGAQATLIHNDDTSMRVQSLRQEIAAAAAEAPSERTGIFTSSLVCQVDAHRIALFFTGREHAGENLDQLLKHRAQTLDKPLQMCDALARNLPKQNSTLECFCLLHGRRNFVEQIGNFPAECQTVIQSLSLVYQVDAEIKEEGLSPEQRLQVHQERSGPVCAQLHRWMEEQLDQKKIEPNSGLGIALKYLLRHWTELTRFLHVAGAPLDNNLCERALKMAILHRKNSLSYKTERGAKVGDVFMSLIHTCELNQINPFDYLIALQNNATQVAADPLLWLPWNYSQAPGPADTG